MKGVSLSCAQLDKRGGSRALAIAFASLFVFFCICYVCFPQVCVAFFCLYFVSLYSRMQTNAPSAAVLLGLHHYLLVANCCVFLPRIFFDSKAISAPDICADLASSSIQVWGIHLPRRLGFFLDAREHLLLEIPVYFPAAALAFVVPPHQRSCTLSCSHVPQLCARGG